MQTFIEETIQDIIKTTNSFEDVTLILPSKRAGVFVKRAFQRNGLVGFLPEILNIEEFIEEVSGLRKIDSIQLLFYFYGIYKEHEENPDTFDTFFSWAFTVLQDFNEIDQHLVKAKEVFMYIRDVERLKKWSVKGTFKETELMKDHFSFTEKLDVFYEKLYQFLLKNKIGYQGCIYREATKNIENYAQENSDKKFFFIGFNALNKSEELLFKTMLMSTNTQVYWDIDEQFLQSNHQAGTFIRKYKTSWKYYQKNELKTVSNTFSEDKNIHLIGAAKNSLQAKYAGEVLSKLSDHNNTALILSDETLLPITLNSLPKNVSSVNITMGYPLKDMPTTSLILSIFQLYLSQEKLQKGQENLFYYKDVVKLLKEPLIHRLLVNDEQSISDEITQIIFSQNRTFVSQEFLSSFLKNQSSETQTIITTLFNPYSNINEFFQRILYIINVIKDKVEGLEKEFLFRYFTAFTQLQNFQYELNYFASLKIVYQFFRQLIASESISFQGEPLQGLQLMGMLETRLLDFENIILTSVNEGILPANTNQVSFIPFDAKVEFGLPTYKEKDAIFSYHFFRLLQRAKNVYLIYNTENDSFGGGEKSRFITQLELLKGGIKTKIISARVTINETKLEEIAKTEAVQNKLKELAEKGISPSTIGNYLYNPIAFYKKKILKIKEFDALEEEVAFNTLGTVVHETLKDLYEPTIGRLLTLESIDKMKTYVETYVKKYFKEYFKNGDITTGRNRLIYEVAIRFVFNFLQQESAIIANSNNQLKVLEVEKDYEAFIDVDGLDFPIKIRGQVDRVDELNGVLRIIDYKTGLVKESDLKVANLEEIQDFKYSKAIQVLLYTYMYTQNVTLEADKQIQAGIISFKNLKSGFLKLNFSDKYRGQDYTVTPEKIEEFIDQMKVLILEIYNPEIPFKEPVELPF